MPKRDLTAIAQGSSADLQPIQRGRGLSGLISAHSGVALENARRLPLDAIDINLYQSRQSFNENTLEELAESIRLHDVLQPIGVRRGSNPNRYEILFGERRYRAAQIAGKADIPAVVYENLDEADAAILTALENLQREDLDIEDEARQFAYLQQVTGLSQRKLGQALGKERQYISRRIRLLKRPDLLQDYRTGLKTLHQVLSLVGSDPEDIPSDTRSAEETGSAGPTLEAETGSAGPTAEEQNWPATGIDLVEREDLGGYSYLVERRPQPDAGSSQGSRSSSHARGGARFRWRPLQQFYTWVGRMKPEEVPVDERASVKAQVAEIKARLEQLERALDETDRTGEAGQTEEPASSSPE